MTSAFRHDPGKQVFPIPENLRLRWETEPAVCGFRRLRHQSERTGRSVAVPVCSTPAVIPGQGVVVGGYDGWLRCFGPDLDDISWETRLNSPIYASLVVDTRNQVIVAASTKGQIKCIDTAGTELWSVESGAPVYATPAVDSAAGALYVAAFGSRAVGLDLATGGISFDRPLPPPWHSAAGGRAAHRDPYASPALTADGNVVYGCAEHAVCLAPDGRELWRRDLGASVRSSPAVIAVADEIAVCSVDGTCALLDSRTGSPVWQVNLGAKIVASPAVSGEVLVAGTRDGGVVGVDVLRHDVIWTSSAGAPRDHTSFTVLPNGDFVATTTHGNIEARARRTGRFLWETSQLLGLAEHDPAMDITPVAAADGSMYCGSYSGELYCFRFRIEDRAAAGAGVRAAVGAKR